ncbi:MAG: hypothetical protein ACPGQD_05590 [Planctomycetota bacterium]
MAAKRTSTKKPEDGHNADPVNDDMVDIFQETAEQDREDAWTKDVSKAVGAAAEAAAEITAVLSWAKKTDPLEEKMHALKRAADVAAMLTTDARKVVRKIQAKINKEAEAAKGGKK